MRQKINLLLAKVRGEQFEAGSFDIVTFEDGALLGDGRRLAGHDDHQWVNDKGRFTRIEINEPVELCCENRNEKSRTFGPYSQLSCVDGVAYVDQRIFAFYDQQQRDWYVYDDGRHWKSVIVAPPAPRSSRVEAR